MKLADVKRFNNGLKAAITLHVPLQIGNGPGKSGNQLTENQLDRWENLIESRLSDGQTLEAISQSGSELTPRYLAALDVFRRTGSMAIVLDGLTVNQIATAKVTRVLRWPMIYFFVVLLIAFAGLWIFQDNLMPMVEDMHTDILLTSDADHPDRFDVLPWIPAIVVGLGVASGLALIWILLGGTRRFAMWLGGRHYVRCKTSATAIRTVQFLKSLGVSSGEAVSLSCLLTGADDQVKRNVEMTAELSEDSKHFIMIADSFKIAANQRLNHLTVGAPVALVSGMGGLVVAVYGFLFFWPVISILKDIATSGT